MDELGMIARIAASIRDSEGKAEASGVVLGLGDDAAILDLPPGERLLVTTDMLIEGTHFLRAQIPWAALGHKLIAVNLSDIAAMGGIPRFAVVSLGLDARVSGAEVEALYRGLLALAKCFNTQIVGGDTVYSPTLTLGLTLIGTAAPGKALRRSQAKPGDQLLVTGTLGKAAAGLAVLQGKAAVSEPVRAAALKAHFCPWPRVKEGRILAALGTVNALIDISDGLASEVGHLCTQSRVGAEIYWDALPLASFTQAVAKARGRAPEEWALSGGEDYELLMAVPAEQVAASRVALEAVGCCLTPVGVVRPAKAGITLMYEGKPQPLKYKGYDHFAPIIGPKERA